MNSPPSKTPSGFRQSKLLRDSLTEAINRYGNYTDIEWAPNKLTFADHKQVAGEIKEHITRIASLDLDVTSLPDYSDIIHEPVIISAYELSAKDVEDDKIPSMQSLSRFVETFTPPPPPPQKFKCSLCDKQFDKLWVVKRHIKEHAEVLEQYILPVQE